MARLDNKKAASKMASLQKMADDMSKGKGAAVGAACFQNGKYYFGMNTPGSKHELDYGTHAEVDAIKCLNEDALQDTGGAALITTRSPCIYCAAFIIDAHISVLYTPPLRTGSKWYDSQCMALKLMNAVGIEVITIEAEGVKG